MEIDQLRALPLSHTDLRCLLCDGYIEHAQECTTDGVSQRIFQHLSTLVLPERSCFVLTAKGQEVVSELSEREWDGMAAREELPAVPCSPVVLPFWDRSSRQLCWQNRLIKRFHRMAVNQELVLTVLQEEGWPSVIDDPLPPTDGMDSKVRLHDTIKALNRHHLHRILRFRGDGSGRGIRWILLNRD